MMMEEEREHLRAKLTAMQSEILAISGSAAQDLKPVMLDQTSVGQVSRVDAMQLQQMSQEAARRRQQLLVKIEGRLTPHRIRALWPVLSVRGGDRPSPPERGPHDYAMPRLR